ncbi:MAG: HEAT repeat domain-containing protein [Phycisphaerales bacterium]
MPENRTRYSRFIVVLACLAMALSGTASAGVHVGIGFGTVIGPHHPQHVHGWYGGWHAWPDYYWYDPCWDPWYEPWPVVVVPPVVVQERRVIIEEHKPAPLPKVEKAEPLSEKQLQKRSELLKVLKIGDAGSRAQAVRDLEPFARDQNVRTALEQVLSKDRDPQIRAAVAELFSRLRDPKTVPALKQAYAEDEDRDVQQAAYKALVMIEGYAGV